ncbi:hypothetical protein [Robiginitalea sp. SC105]|uniref:hypothetical protein n=1 Tax=Robiginitalea sp. SC105 TaxID=2762332 RepID=UPI00163AB946|nr:hypothetical protein [Robiginitalea sp. SC105]MBC2840099.1 hypothetical protein [Robiginitalea sp. SC105]
MEKEARIKYFEGLKKKKPYSHKDIYYKGKKQKLPVYEIDLDYLIYNQWNGRIASLVKSHAQETGEEIDASTEEGAAIIEDFLWRSNIPANKATEKSIFDQGQNEYGIVTKDGVIIDGNRRSMILRRVAEKKKESPVYFLGVVLDEVLDDDPKEIMRLETTYQMGEDAKVDYNAIEKYLKCQDLIELGFSSKEIGKMMGESESKIKEYLSIMDLMNEYLEQDQLGYGGIYTRLDKTEGAFVDLNGYLKRYEGGKSKMVQWKYDETDLNDLKMIYFDYIRGIYNSSKSADSGDSKDYRFIGRTSKKGSFFSNEKIWEKFRDKHFDEIEEINQSEPSIDEIRKDHPSESLEILLKGRDVAWANRADSVLKRNMGRSKSALENKNNRDRPLELLESAKDKLDSINTKSKSFLEDDDVYTMVNEIRKLSEEFKRIILKHDKHSK